MMITNCCSYFLTQLKMWHEFMKETDENDDGQLDFPEFQETVKLCQQRLREMLDAETTGN